MGSILFYFCPFLITISINKLKKAYMVCLGFKPAAADGRRRQYHGAMAVTQAIELM